MAKYNKDDYEVVEVRLKKFWKDYPDGRVFTEVVKTSDDGTMVIVKAMVYLNREDVNPVSTGLAQETKGQGGFANADAWMENCETSAIGRALANWKYQGSTKKRPSQEEMSKVQPIQKTGRVKDIVIEQEDAELKKAKQDFAKDIGADEQSVADQISDIIKDMCPDAKLRKQIKDSAWQQSMEDNLPKEIEDWSDGDMKTFLGHFGTLMQDDKAMLDSMTTDISDTQIQCPEPQCNKFEWIVDNREKKASDDKFANIPDFTCDNYGPDKDGCGKGWYIGSKDFPFDKWL